MIIKSGEVFGHMVESMKGIEDSSRKMSEIIQIIDDTIGQTYIPALQAADEALRTVEKRLDFTLVVSGVRNLACCSA